MPSLVLVTGYLTSALCVRSDVEEEVVLVDVLRDFSDNVGILELQGYLGRGGEGRGGEGHIMMRGKSLCTPDIGIYTPEISP